MMLSFRPKLGAIQVRGGRFLRVTTGHRVLTSTFNANEVNRRPGVSAIPFPPGTKHVFTKEGDLALEIYGVKADKVLGYSYLSGPALLLNAYDAQPGWFGPAFGVRVEIPGPSGPDDTVDAIVDRMAAELVPFKHSSGIDIAVFQVLLPPGVPDETPSLVSHCIIRAWMNSAAVPSDKCHLLGTIERDRERGLLKKKKPIAMGLHFQPPCDACDFQAGQFQTGLAMSAVGIEAT